MRFERTGRGGEEAGDALYDPLCADLRLQETAGRGIFHAGKTHGLCAPCSRVYRPDLPTEEKSAKNIERFPAGAGKMAL